MVSLPSDKSIPRDQREGGRGREEDQSGGWWGGGGARERPAQKTGKKELTPTKVTAQTACAPPQDWTHTSGGVMGQFGDCSPLGTGSPLLEPPERSE